ncbi:MAG: DUF559 domain-containing protein [Acidobacteriota bacterium]
MKPLWIDHARELRRRSTVMEAKLWSCLRARRLDGARFRRQHPIGRWIADFYCPESKLVIELDGGGHAAPEKAASDVERDNAFREHGIRVLRFWNTDIHLNVDGVLQRISEVLKDPSPRPSPRKRGEGGG